MTTRRRPAEHSDVSCTRSALVVIATLLLPFVAACTGDDDGGFDNDGQDDVELDDNDDNNNGNGEDNGDDGNGDVGDVDPNCFGDPREEPMAGFDTEMEYLGFRDAQVRLLDCLERDSVTISYRAQGASADEATDVEFSVDIERSNDLVTQSGVMTTNGETFSFMLDDDTATVVASDGTVTEVASDGALSIVDVGGLPQVEQLRLLHTAALVAASTIAIGINFESLGAASNWEFSDSGDNVSARLADLTLSYLDDAATVEEVELVLTDGAVPIEATMRMVGDDFDTEFAMTID